MLFLVRHDQVHEARGDLKMELYVSGTADEVTTQGFCTGKSRHYVSSVPSRETAAKEREAGGHDGN